MKKIGLSLMLLMSSTGALAATSPAGASFIKSCCSAVAACCGLGDCC